MFNRLNVKNNMSYLFSFEKLNVWIDSKELIKIVYAATRKFPEEEKFGLTSQIRISSISVASNLAEGTSRKTNKDKAYFTTISYSSLMEVLNQIIIAKDLNFIDEDDYQIVRKSIEKIANKLNALRNSQINL